jgi:putative nucleotidyltransferase with HDIG domain
MSKQPFSWLRRRRKHLARYLGFALAAMLVVAITPNQPNFKYEFQLNKPWMHQDLIAPFDFPIAKSKAQLEEEREQIRRHFVPYYERNEEVAQAMLEQFGRRVRAHWDTSLAVNTSPEAFVRRCSMFMKDFFEEGIVKLAEKHRDSLPGDRIRVLTGQVAELRRLESLYTLDEARQQAVRELKRIPGGQDPSLQGYVLQAIQPNIHYKRSLSQTRLQEQLESISPYRGMVQEGEKIISRGSIVTRKKYQVLQSLKNEFRNQMQADQGLPLLPVGYSLIVLSLFVLLLVYLQRFHQDLYTSDKGLTMVVTNILLFVLLSVLTLRNEAVSLYLLPYCILPIIVSVFFGPRAAFMVHLTGVLCVSLLAPIKFDFIVVETLAGVTTVLTMNNIRYLAQFFLSTMLILLTYWISYLGLTLIEITGLEEVSGENFLWFGGSFLLTLLAYPLIYAYEKIFGFTSDVSLIELGDVSNKLLRSLSINAPGTFQHSLQVANISEHVVGKLGGNPLLARVASLYHDIGKMTNAAYFIENQRYMVNPHDELSPEESAQTIIGHVSEGVRIARQQGLPKSIIDIITTHHGTSRVEFFYQKHLKELDEDAAGEGEEHLFRYPGPKPQKKEEAVIMIVDSVEAASRSLRQPDSERLNSLIDRIVDGKLMDGQFSEADITLREINLVRYIVKEYMATLYHVRIEYPESGPSSAAPATTPDFNA